MAGDLLAVLAAPAQSVIVLTLLLSVSIASTAAIAQPAVPDGFTIHVVTRVDPPAVLGDIALDDGPVSVNSNRALPLQARLFDQNGSEVTGVHLGEALPVLQ